MMKFKKIACNLIVLSLLLCSCGKKESLVNNVSAKENEVKKNEIVESKKNNEIVESEDVVKLKSELSESQGALEKEKEKTKEVQDTLRTEKQKVSYLLLGVILVPAMIVFGMAFYIADLRNDNNLAAGYLRLYREEVLRLEALLDNAHIQH